MHLSIKEDEKLEHTFDLVLTKNHDLFGASFYYHNEQLDGTETLQSLGIVNDLDCIEVAPLISVQFHNADTHIIAHYDIGYCDSLNILIEKYCEDHQLFRNNYVFRYENQEINDDEQTPLTSEMNNNAIINVLSIINIEIYDVLESHSIAWQVSPNDNFQYIMDDFFEIASSEMEGSFFFNNRELRSDETPNSIGMVDGDVICLEKVIEMQVWNAHIRNLSDPYRIKYCETLGTALMDRYCEDYGFSNLTAIFMYRGTTLSRSDSPAFVEMEDAFPIHFKNIEWELVVNKYI